MNYNLKKITLIISTTLLLNACVTGGKDVISSAKEKVFNRESNENNNVGLSLEADNIEKKELENIRNSKKKYAQ